MSELAANPEYRGLQTQEPNGLVVEAVDERALSEARERTVARLRLVWNARRFLFRVALWGLALSTALAFLIPKHYESTVRLMPPESPSIGGSISRLIGASGQAAEKLASLVAPTVGVANPGAPLLVGVLKSDTVRDDLIHKFNLQKVYKTRYLEDARKELAAHTGISEDVLSGIITITVTDRQPQRAAGMAAEYVEVLNRVVNQLSTSAARRERTFLEQRLGQVKQDLETAERQFSQFSAQKGAIDIQAQGKAMVEAAAVLQGQLIAAESELQALRQIYTDNNVRVRSLEARVSELRLQLEKMAGKGVTESSTADQLYPSLRQLPLLGVNYADLLRRVRVEEAIYETLTKEYELAKVEEAREIPTVKVLDPPEVPQKKSFPPHLLAMALGTFLALAAGTAWVLGHAAWEATETTDPRKALASEVWSDVREALPWAPPNGAGLGRLVGWLRKKVRRSRVETAEESDPPDASTDCEADRGKQAGLEGET